MSDESKLRTMFNEIAELYNSARPIYPQMLFDKLLQEIHLAPDAKLLEIGPGTGQATKPLAKIGFDITAIELGSELAKIARRELKDYPNVNIITSAFEDIELPSNTFDLVYSATAFHWIKPDVRFLKPFNLLKPSGHLAIIHTEHISDEINNGFFEASQPIYNKYGLSDSNNRFQPSTFADLRPTVIDKNLFSLNYFKAFPITNTYSAKQFTDLLSTYSPQRAMTSEQRQAFLNDIAKLINEKFGGSIDRRFAMTLLIAKRN
jgi:ubiquinone/menaquinone biosynthesis C-methylase UbiE